MADFQLAPEARIGLVALRVAHMDQMVDFYTKVVGLVLLKRTETAAYLGIQPNQQVLVTLRKVQAPQQGDHEVRLTSYTLLLPKVGDLKRVLKHIVELGIKTSPIMNNDYVHSVQLTDPEGNNLKLAVSKFNQSWDDYIKIDWLHLDATSQEVERFLENTTTKMATLPAGTALGWVELSVASLADSLAFYNGRLGYVSQTDEAAGRAWLVSAENAHSQIRMTQETTLAPQSTESIGLDYLNIKLPLAEMLADLDRSLTEDGVGHQYSASDEYLFVSDPNHFNVSFSLA